VELLPVPAQETIDRFETELDGLASDRRAFQQQLEDLEKESLELDRQIQELELRQALPTEENLEEARRQRDASWQQIRQAWEQATNSSQAKAQELGAAFEVNVQNSDEIADRLRREADQVAAKARCLADRDRCGQRLAKVTAQLDRIEMQRESTGRDWSALW